MAPGRWTTNRWPLSLQGLCRSAKACMDHGVNGGQFGCAWEMLLEVKICRGICLHIFIQKYLYSIHYTHEYYLVLLDCFLKVSKLLTSNSNSFRCRSRFGLFGVYPTWGPKAPRQLCRQSHVLLWATGVFFFLPLFFGKSRVTIAHFVLKCFIYYYLVQSCLRLRCVIANLD